MRFKLGFTWRYLVCYSYARGKPVSIWPLAMMISLLALFGCREATGVSGEVVLYTSVPADIIDEIEMAFETQYPAVDLQIYRGNTGNVMARIKRELASGGIGADLVWVADGTAGEDLEAQGVLLQYVPPEAESLLPALRDDDGHYFAARLLNMVVAYNTNAIDTPPSGYQELLNPRYRGRVGHANPADSGAFLYFMGVMLQNPSYGDEFFRLLANNKPTIQSNMETTERIAAGELDIGITIDFTVRKYLKDHPEAPIGFVYPEAGVVMVPSPIAIFQDASNIAGAKAFERFVLSRSGQSLLRDLAGVVPVRLDVEPPPGIESITQLSVLPADLTWIRVHRDEILSVFDSYYGER